MTIKKFKRLKPKSYLSLFGEEFESIETDKYMIGIYPNEFDDFRSFSYVNGLHLKRGGSHVDHISSLIVNGVRDKLQRKHKNIKPGDIRNKIFLVLIFKRFPNIQIDAQTKESIRNVPSEINSYLEDDLSGLIKNVLKNDKIIDPIIDIFKAKEEYNAKKELKTKQKKKPVFDEKFMPAIGENIDCFLAEGDSAANSVSRILGRQGKSYYSMFGVFVNVHTMPIQAIVKSKKVIGLSNVLGFDLTKKEQYDLECQNIVIATDQDLAGFHIRGVLMAFFYRFGKNLFDEGRIKIFRTPIAVIKKKDAIITWYYSLQDLNNHKYKIGEVVEYKKGLGSWEQEDLEYIINQDGLDKMIEPLCLTEKSHEYFEGWFGDDTSFRKEKILGSTFNIHSM